jgi:nucleolar protein 58
MIEMAAVVYECDCCVMEREHSLRLAAQHLKEISQIDDTDGWDLLKIATALMIICKPTDKIRAAKQVNYTLKILRILWI